MKKITLLLAAFFCLMTVSAAEGGSLTSAPAVIDPTSDAVITYDGTGTNFANWTPQCYVHAWLVDKEGKDLGSYSTAWASCNGDADYAALDDKLKMTNKSSGVYEITINIQSFFNVADEDLAKIGKLGIIVRAQYDGEANKTQDLLLDVEMPTVVTDTEELYNLIGKRVRMDEVYNRDASLTVFTAGEERMLYLGLGYMGYFSVKSTAAVDGVKVPGSAFSIIGTVKEGGDYGVYVEISSIIAYPAVSFAGISTQIPDVAYLGETISFSNIVVYGENLNGENVTIAISSPTDTEAEYTFSKATLTVDEISTIDGSSIEFSIAPKAVSPTVWGENWLGDPVELQQTTYYITASLDGELMTKDSIIMVVKEPNPEFSTDYVAMPYGDIYVGETYEATFDFLGNKFIPETVTIEAAPGSGIISITPSEFKAADLQSMWGVEGVTVTFIPTTVGKNIAIPFIIKGEGMEPIICNDLVCDEVLEKAPALDFGSGILTGDVFATAPTSKRIYVTGNPFVTKDVEFAKIHEDIDSIVPAKLTAAQLAEGDYITVYVTPKAASDTRVDFTFSATSEELETTALVYANKILAPAPKLTVAAPGWISATARTGQVFTQTLQITGNHFITKDVTITSKAGAEITNITPSVIPAADLVDKSVTVTVEFIPTTVSDLDQWGDPVRREFTVEVTSEEIEEAIPATFKFGVLPPAELLIELAEADNVQMGYAYVTVGEEAEIKLIAKGQGLTQTVYAEISCTGYGACNGELSSPYLNSSDINSATGFDFYLYFTAEEAGFYTCNLVATSSDFTSAYETTIYIQAEEAGETTALENVGADAQVTKIVENGQVYILKDGAKYNVLGTVVK